MHGLVKKVVVMAILAVLPLTQHSLRLLVLRADEFLVVARPKRRKLRSIGRFKA